MWVWKGMEKKTDGKWYWGHFIGRNQRLGGRLYSKHSMKECSSHSRLHSCGCIEGAIKRWKVFDTIHIAKFTHKEKDSNKPIIEYSKFILVSSMLTSCSWKRRQNAKWRLRNCERRRKNTWKTTKQTTFFKWVEEIFLCLVDGKDMLPSWRGSSQSHQYLPNIATLARQLWPHVGPTLVKAVSFGLGWV